MDDVVVVEGRTDADTRPRLDLQQHLADLEARGLLTRIDHPVNKDTELHPLVRLQFIGGIPEAERRAFLFTNVVDGSGKRYDMPVVVARSRPRRRFMRSAWAAAWPTSAKRGSTRLPIRSLRCVPPRRAARRW